MIYTTKQLLKKHKNNTSINRMEKSGKLFRVAQGVYSDEQINVADLESIFLVYKNAILTNESAFAFYELTDNIPEKYSIVTPLKSHRISFKGVEQSYMQDSILKIGLTKAKTEYGYINIYDKERLLVELFRLRNKFSYELYKEVVANYRKLAMENKIDFLKVFKYCDKFAYSKTIKNKIEEIIL